MVQLIPLLTSLITLTPLLLPTVTADLPHSRGRSIHHQHRHHHEKIRAAHGNAQGVDLAGRSGAGLGESRKVKKRAGEQKVCRIKTGSGSGNATTSATGSSTAGVSSSAVASSAQTSSTPASSSSAPSSPTSAPSSSSQAQSPSSSSAPAPSSSSSSGSGSGSSGGGASANSVPNGKKAGIAGGDSMQWMKDHIGSWSDWGADGDAMGSGGSPTKMAMIWGGGIADATDASRLSTFESLSYTPKYVIGFEEPDCAAGGGSAGLDVGTAVSLWNQHVVPMQKAGSIVLSPSMCHQAAETGWLGPFKNQISQMWDITNVHINKNNMKGVQDDIDHYVNTYGKPLFVTEFACVDDSSDFIPCTDQGEINQYISDIVDLFEKNDNILGYMYSDGMGLGSVWPTVSGGQLSASGQAYLNAISKYH